MRILHLSADYPDPINSQKTAAIRNLLNLAPQYKHRVYSLNRAGWYDQLSRETFADEVSDTNNAVLYPAPPMGILHRRFLSNLAHWIIQDCESADYRPELIHAHKLTVEGLSGRILSQHFNVPLIISAQGNTDLKIITARPDLRADFREIWQRASVALPFAPWTEERLRQLLGQRAGPTHCLPCPGSADSIAAPVNAAPIIRTAFHLQDYRNKNAARLIRAVGILAQDVPTLVLEIIGGNDDHARKNLQRLADRHAPGHVRFLGHIPHRRMPGLLNTSAAFALVSHQESFGMVFAEALLAGAPCLIPKGRAIDGYLANGQVTLTANPSDTGSIADGLRQLLVQQDAFKRRLTQYQSAGKLDFLRRNAIARTYSDALSLAHLRHPVTNARNRHRGADAAPLTA